MNDETKEWLDFAESDLRAAKILLEADHFPAVCFHSQQATEKALKAVLVSREQKVVRTHSLTNLISLVETEALDDIAVGLAKLDDVYSSIRYPDVALGSLPDRLPNKEDAVDALATAQLVFARMRQLIEEGGKS
jgi:HEPN domain-containing protein